MSAIFKRVDADGDGTIDLDELRVYVSRRGFPAAQADRAFDALDDNGDGVLSLEEWRAGLEKEELRQLLRPETDDALQDAVVVCGYGPVGRAACAAISGHAPVVAVDLDPARVADGVVDDEGRPTQLELIEIAQGVTIEDIKAATGCGFRVADGHRSRWLQPMMQEPSDIPPSRVAAP